MTGFTSTSLRSYSVKEVVDIAARAGAQMIEWGSDSHIKTAADAVYAKNLCAEKGILIRSYGTYYRVGSKKEKEWEEICRVAAAMGAKYIRVWAGRRGSRFTTEKEYFRLLDDARLTADTAAVYGLTVCYECHPNTYNDTAQSSLRFMREIRRENVKTYYQSWYRHEQKDRDKLIKTFGYVQDVHLSFSELEKFQRFRKKDPDYIKKILQWLKELGFDNGLFIEFTKRGRAENLIADTERLENLWKNV